MMTVKENVDYELIPADEDYWHVRIISGDYIETVIKFNSLKVKNKSLHYSYDIVYSPDADLTIDDSGLIEVAGNILYSILDNESSTDV